MVFEANVSAPIKVLAQYPRPDLPGRSAYVATRTTVRQRLCLRYGRLFIRHSVVLGVDLRRKLCRTGKGRGQEQQ